MDKESFLISRLSSAYIGDDAAIVGKYLYSMDAFFEGTHFKREWMSPAQIGTKAMLVNLSDAVAMNADPLYALTTVAIPQQMPYEEIEALMQALERTASDFGCEIIGGDTIASDKLCISIALVSQSDAPLLRTGLQKGDLIAYTGTLGESKRDLEALMRGERIAPDSRFYLPELRREFVRKAREYLRCGMDISDGLYCDTNKLLEINRLGMRILKNINPDIGLSGEEYEMLVAFAPSERQRVNAIAKSLRLPLTVFAKAVDYNNVRFACQSHHFS